MAEIQPESRRKVLDLVDPGAESPRETWLRLLLIRNGFPRPTTQIPVYDDYGALVAELDMGWESIKVAAEYEGDHHRTDPDTFNKGIRRHDELTELGWIDVRVPKGTPKVASSVGSLPPLRVAGCNHMARTRPQSRRDVTDTEKD